MSQDVTSEKNPGKSREIPSWECQNTRFLTGSFIILHGYIIINMLNLCICVSHDYVIPNKPELFASRHNIHVDLAHHHPCCMVWEILKA